jgi:hypothetical protein
MYNGTGIANNARRDASGLSAGLVPGSHQFVQGGDVTPVSGTDYAGALGKLARQFAGSNESNSVRNERNGYGGLHSASNGMMGTSFPQAPAPTRSNFPNSKFASVDMGKHFKTGQDSMTRYPVLPGKRTTPHNDDTGSQGSGTSKTNEVQTMQCTLQPTAYETIYNNETLMKGHIPENGFAFLFVPEDDINRERVVIHSVSTINRWFHATRPDRDETFKDGTTFAKHWKFLGVPLSIERHQGGMSTSNVIASICVRGPQRVRNMWGATGMRMVCGMRLFFILRKVYGHDVQADCL